MQYPVSKPALSHRESALVLECLQNNQLTQGPMVARFERELGSWLAAPHMVAPEVIAVSNGTVAIMLALMALDVKAGDEVIVPDLTYVATANAAALLGATVVLADVDVSDWTIDVTDVASKITRRTKAIIPVDLYGVPADYCALRTLAQLNGVALVEDAAEGLGGFWHDRPLGTLGNIGTFSFYGNKILTTGEGGACVTYDRGLATRLRHLRNAAQTSIRYFHDRVAINARMTDLQAAVGVAQLEQFDGNLALRRAVMTGYTDVLWSALGGQLHTPFVRAGMTQAPWLFTFECRYPEDVRNRLAGFGIDTRPLFTPLHRMPMYRDNEPFRGSEVVGLSLPTWPGLTERDVNYIAEKVVECIV